MRFLIGYDSGDRILGWIVPDNPLAISRVVVSVEGRRVAEVPATIHDETFKRNGWHSTGQCTFELDEAVVPGLGAMPRLELYDADTNVMVHRRVPGAGFVERRVILLNTSINPETALQGMLFPHFRQSYFGLDNLSDEILTSILASQTMPSSLLSGAIPIPRYEGFFTPELMLSAILVHDPYVELATRMHWLRARAGVAADPEQAWRLGPNAEAARFAVEYDYEDPRSLKRFFRMLPEPAYHLLYNPLTRQLGTPLPGDRVHPGNSIVAIEILARVGVVGHRNYFEAFASTLLDQLGLDAAVPTPPPIPAEVRALAARLRGVKGVSEMLVFDLVMAEAVLSSVARNWGG